MGVARLLRYGRLAFLSKDAADRQLFQAVKRRRVRRIVEIGIDSLDRTSRMLSLVTEYAGGEPAWYSGFDAFEERADDLEPLTLIAAYRALQKTRVQVRLTPGEMALMSPATANGLTDADLLLFSARLSDAQLAPVWRYVPRMCHPGTTVLRAGEEGCVEMSLETVSELAAAAAASGAIAA